MELIRQKEALENIRKIAGLCVRCMEYNETPKRKYLTP